jgi:uncharacterized membrane protein
MNSRSLLDVLHVLTAMVFVAGLVGRSASFERAGQAQDIQSVGSLLHMSEWFERTLVIPAYFGVLLSGMATAWNAGWPLWGAMTSGAPKWVLISLLLFLSPWLVIPTYLAPRRKRRARALAEALSQQRMTTELASAVQDRGVVLVRRAEIAMTAIVIVLMVAKLF